MTISYWLTLNLKTASFFINGKLETKQKTNAHFFCTQWEHMCSHIYQQNTHEDSGFCCASRWKICPYFWKRIRLRWAAYKENQLEAKQLPLKLACINSTKCTFQPAFREHFIKEKDIQMHLEDAELWALKYQIFAILSWTQLACFELVIVLTTTVFQDTNQ